jgi:hypothetical protein
MSARFQLLCWCNANTTDGARTSGRFPTKGMDSGTNLRTQGDRQGGCSQFVGPSIANFQ